MITFKDFIYSDTAKVRKIDNNPTDKDIISNISKTVQFLNGLNWPDLKISSGYRCENLNRAVGGESTSHHKVGYAVDVTSGNIKGLLELLKSKLDCLDQLIYYPKRNFIHISIHPNNRKQFFIK